MNQLAMGVVVLGLGFAAGMASTSLFNNDDRHPDSEEPRKEYLVLSLRPQSGCSRASLFSPGIGPLGSGDWVLTESHEQLVLGRTALPTEFKLAIVDQTQPNATLFLLTHETAKMGIFDAEDNTELLEVNAVIRNTTLRIHIIPRAAVAGWNETVATATSFYTELRPSDKGTLQLDGHGIKCSIRFELDTAEGTFLK